MTSSFKIGTRGSPLALAQAREVAQLLAAAHPALASEGAIQIVPIVTTGDKTQADNRPLTEIGGKGLFTKEIEDALGAGEIDCAVHSMKDMPTVFPEGLDITCLLPREDVRDVFFSPLAATPDDLPQGAVIGSSSLRRQAILLARRPDLKVITFRGNVGTRLKKLDDKIADATILAAAGLHRLGLRDKIQHYIPTDIMLPAVAQGAIGIETKIDNTRVRDLLAPLHCGVTALRVAAERAFLAEMDGSCRMPLAALASIPDARGHATFEALTANPDGTNLHRIRRDVTLKTLTDAQDIGRSAGEALKSRAAA